MRWLISATAFCVPLMLTLAIGSCFTGAPAGSGSARPTISPTAMDELHRYVQSNVLILDQYTLKPGDQPSPLIPHLALDRFDLCGVDEHGHPWYRLAQPPHGVSCGVLRRAADDRKPVGAIEGRPAVVLLPLAGPWSYWETRPPPAGAAKSP